MRNRILLSLLFSITLLAVVLALGYSYYDIKQVSGLVTDPEARPITGATVTAAGTSALTDGTGRYVLYVPRGSYTLIAFAEGFGSTEQPINSEPLFEKDLQVDLTLRPLEFTTTVVATDLRRPIAGATLQIEGGSSAVSDERGRAAMRGVKTGEKLTISAPGYRPETLQFEPENMQEIALSPALTTIEVVDMFSKLPLAGAQVTAGDQAGQTSTDGKLILRAMAAGTTVTAQAAGYASAQLAFQGEEGLTLALRPTRVDGVLQDSATGKPIANALILYGSQRLRTDAGGQWHLEAISSTLSLSVKYPGYRYTTFDFTDSIPSEIKLDPFRAKGLHLYYAMPRQDVLALLDRLKGTDVNAVVLTVKEGPGDIVWDSAVPLARQIGAYHPRGIPPSELVQICRQRGWYCIARQVIYKDYRLGSAHPEWALHYAGGGVIAAGNEIWMNPAAKQVGDYNLALARELAAMGFDEVQFDYIRYPGGRQPAVEFGTVETRLANIKNFLATARDTFQESPTFFSGDVFGLTTATRDEQGIGQRLEEIAPYFDFISPMMYPSTWKGSPNLFRDGLGNPNCPAALECPYEIVLKGTRLAFQRGKALVRPWLQAYGDVNFGVPQYIAQKKGADDANSAGWLFWNNQGLYPDAMWEKK
ncbi:MAG: putative glycoside hydrolase [Rudaea sp.]